MKPTIALCALLTLAPQAISQGVSTAVPTSDLRVPLHSHDSDASGQSATIWAAGADYKASFHDGFAFYPALGKGHERNLPLRWQTKSITAGGAALTTPGQAPRVTFSAWRLERDHGGVVEAYDLREDGVEQTFVIATRPAVAGEISVKGSIETELLAGAFEGHGAIDFRDAQGTALVRYGAAVAVDSTGCRVDMITRYSSGEITLVVPADFVARATYPLTIDPLTSAVSVHTGSGVVQDVAIGAFPNASGRNTVLAVSRYFSVTDIDLYLVACQSDYSSPTLIFSDLDSGWSSTHPSVAACEGANRWVLAFQRDFPSPAQSSIRAYVHDLNNNTLNSGSDLTVTLNVGNTHRKAQVGGSTGANGKKALIVWQTDVTSTQANTPSTAVNGRVLDAATKTFSTGSFALHSSAGTTFDREAPCVSRMAADAGPWVVAWQVYDNSIPGDDWDLLGARITQSGVVTGDAIFDGGKAVGHSVTPKLAGQAGRYTISWTNTILVTGTSGQQLYARRFDWGDAASFPTVQTIRTVDSIPLASGFLINAGIAYDTTTTSHWAISYRHEDQSVAGSIRMARLGSSAGVVEKVTGFTNNGTELSSDIAFRTAPGQQYFQIGFKANVVNNPAYGVNFLYQNAGTSLYGTGCGGTLTLEPPLAGDEFYKTSISGIQANTPVALFVSGKIASIGLGSIGMAGCFLNVDTGSYVALSTSSSAAGQVTMPLPLPDYPVAVTGDIYTQWIWLAPGSNTLGVLASQGVKHMIR